ncbi:hypothetical protein DSECCO2_504200 [anaerobic digester metagenome]
MVAQARLAGAVFLGAQVGGLEEAVQGRVDAHAVSVDLDLAVQGQQFAAFGHDQGVDLGQEQAVAQAQVEKGGQEAAERLHEFPGQAEVEEDVADLVGGEPRVGHGVLDEDRLGVAGLDVDAASASGRDAEAAAAAVEGHGQVHLPAEGRSGLDAHQAHPLPFDVQGEEAFELRPGLLGGVGQADAPGLAAAAAQDLGLEDPGQGERDVWKAAGREKHALGDRDAGFLEKLFAAVFIELHDAVLASAVVKPHPLDYHRGMARRGSSGIGWPRVYRSFRGAYLPCLENQEKLQQLAIFAYVSRSRCN